MSSDELRIAQALADVATIGILQERAIRWHETVAEQLQTALNSRVIIEETKGCWPNAASSAEAFNLLRNHARSTGQRLSDVARSVIDGTTTTTTADALRRSTRRQPTP